MPRLIDVDQLKKEWHMGDICETCSMDTRQCGNDYCFSRMDVCGMLDDAPTANGWISVKDRIPENDRSYLTVGPRGVMRVAKAYIPAQVLKTYGGDPNDVLWTCEGRFVKATHWMPLPEPPEESRHGNR